MVLYSHIVDPVGHCVRMVLSEKDISCDIRYVYGDERPQEVAEVNPYDTVLTLTDRDLALYDAQIIMEYLDERFPHPPLMPVDPVTRANNRQIRYRIMRDLYALLSDLDQGSGSQVTSARKQMRDHLTALTPAFSQTAFFMSDEFSLVDCTFAPLLWRLDYYGVKLPATAKAVVRYAQRIFDRPGFRGSLSDQEVQLHGL